MASTPVKTSGGESSASVNYQEEAKKLGGTFIPSTPEAKVDFAKEAEAMGGKFIPSAPEAKVDFAKEAEAMGGKFIPSTPAAPVEPGKTVDFHKDPLQEMGFDTGKADTVDALHALVGPANTSDPKVLNALYSQAQKNLDYATSEAQKALHSGASKEQAADIFADKLKTVGQVTSAGTMRYPNTAVQAAKNAFTRGALGFGRDVASIGALAAGAVGADTTSREALNKAQELEDISAQYPGQFSSTQEALAKGDSVGNKAKNLAMRALEGSIENAPSMLTSMGGAGGAKLLAEKGLEAFAKKYGATVTDQLLEKVGKYGVAAGAFGASTALESGSIYKDIYDKTGELHPAVATAFGTLAGALDAIVPAQAVNTIARKEMIEELGKSFAKRYGVDALKSIAEEGATEFLQTFIEKGGVAFVNGDPVFNKRNFNEALDAAFVGSFMGGATHVGSQAIHDIGMKTQGMSREQAKQYFESEQAADTAKEKALNKWKTSGLTAKQKEQAAEKVKETTQAQEAVSTAVPPVVEASEEEKARLIQHFVDSGHTKDNARLLAEQQIAEAQNARRIDSGTTGEGVQVSGQPAGQPVTGGATQSVGPTVVGPGSITGTTEAGTVQQPTTLEPTIPATPTSPLVELMHASGTEFKNPSQVKTFLSKVAPDDIAPLAAADPKVFKVILNEWKATKPTEAAKAPEVAVAPKVQTAQEVATPKVEMPTLEQSRVEVQALTPEYETPEQAQAMLKQMPNPTSLKVVETDYGFVVAPKITTPEPIKQTEAPQVETTQVAEQQPATPVEATNLPEERQAEEETPAPEAVKPKEVVQEQPVADVVEEAVKEEEPPHVAEARHVAARLRAIEPYHPHLEALQSPSVTQEDVDYGRQELDALKPKAIPTPIAPDEESASINEINNVVHDLMSPQQIKDNPPVVVNTYDELPVSDEIKQEAEQGGVKAFVDPKTNKAYYIASQIPKNEIKGTIMHEHGGHVGLTRLIGVPRLAKLATQVNTWAQGGTALENVIAKEAIAMANISGHDKGSNEYQQEVVAYFTEIAVNRYGIDPLKTQPKSKQKVAAWLRELWQGVISSLRKLNTDPSKLTAQDIVTLVQGAARVGTSQLEKAETKAVFTPELLASLMNTLADSSAVTKEIYETNELGKELKILASAKDLNIALGFTKPGIDKTFTELFYDGIKNRPDFKISKLVAVNLFAEHNVPEYPVKAVVSMERTLAQLPPLNLYTLCTADYNIADIYRNPEGAAEQNAAQVNNYRYEFYKNSLYALDEELENTNVWDRHYNAPDSWDKTTSEGIRAHIAELNKIQKAKYLIKYALAKYAMAGNKLLPITEKNEYLPLNGEDITPQFIDFMYNKLDEGLSPKQALNDTFMAITFPQRNNIIESQVGESQTGWVRFSGVDKAQALRLVTADTGSEPGSWCVGRTTIHGRSYLNNNDFSVYVHNGKSLVASTDDKNTGQPNRWYGLGAGQSILPSHQYLLKEHPNVGQIPVEELTPEQQAAAAEKEGRLAEAKEGYAIAQKVITTAATGEVRSLSLIYDSLQFLYANPVTRAIRTGLAAENKQAVYKLTGFSPKMKYAFENAEADTTQAVNSLSVLDVYPEFAGLADWKGDIQFKIRVINMAPLLATKLPEAGEIIAPIQRLLDMYNLPGSNGLGRLPRVDDMLKQYMATNGHYAEGRWGSSNSLAQYLYGKINKSFDIAYAFEESRIEQLPNYIGNENAQREHMDMFKAHFKDDFAEAARPLNLWIENSDTEEAVAKLNPGTISIDTYQTPLTFHLIGHPQAYGIANEYYIDDAIRNVINEYELDIDGYNHYGKVRELKEKTVALGKYTFIANARDAVPPEKLVAIPDNFEEAIENIPKDVAGISQMVDSLPTTTLAEKEAPRILASKKITLPKVKDAMLRIKRSNNAAEMGSAIGDLIKLNNFDDVKEEIADAFNYLDSKRLAAMLPNLTTYQIISTMGKSIPHLTTVTASVEHMSVMRNKMLATIANKSERWTNFNHKNPKQGILLNDVMHFARLQRIDFSAYPSLSSALAKDPVLVRAKKNRDKATKAQERSNYQGQINERIASLTQGFKLWNELGSVDNGEGHKIFKEIKNHYQEMFNLQRAILDERIAKSKVPGDINDATTPKGRLMAAIRKTYETVEEEGGVYFPYMRYGTYWLRVGNGAHKEFYMFESEYQRDRFENKRFRELRAAGDTRTKDEMFEAKDLAKGNRIDQSRDDAAASDELLKGVFTAIDTQKAVDKDALKDAVYQLYLLTMPEQAFRKKYIHAKGTTGFNPDALRNFVRSGYNTANQLSKLKYGPEIRTAISSARESLLGNPKEYKLDMIVTEIEKRVDLEFAPPDEDRNLVKAVNGFNQFVFLWRITAPRSALINLTALPNFGLPSLIAEFGEKDATVGLAKFAKVWQHTTVITPDGKFTPVSVGFSDHVQSIPALKQAFEEAVDREITEVTRTHDLLAMGRVPSDQYRNKVARGYAFGIKAAGFLFHHTERLNREIMFMTSFELAYNKYLTDMGLQHLIGSQAINDEAYNKAIDKAIELTNRSMFNYTRFNRPRYMRHTILKPAVQFRLYAQQVTENLTTSFLHMIPFVEGHTAKRAAAKQFFGTLLMVALEAGICGMPFAIYWPLIHIIHAIFAKQRKEGDPPPMEEINVDLWFRNEWLPQVFGEYAKPIANGPISYYSNVDIGSGTSLANIWFRDSQSDPSLAATMKNMAYDLSLGAGGGVATDFITGYEDIKKGFFNEGVNKFLPAPVKGPHMAWYWHNEGVMTKNQMAPFYRKEQVTPGMLISKSLGFNPTELSIMQEFNYPMKQIEQDLLHERAEIMDRMNIGLAHHQPAVFQQALLDAVKFTRAYPEIGFDDTDKIADSLTKRAEIRAMADHGLVIDPRLMPRVYKFAHASRPHRSKEEDAAMVDAMVEFQNRIEEERARAAYDAANPDPEEGE